MPRRKIAKDKPKLTIRQYLVAMIGVVATTYRAAPLAIIAQGVGAVLTAVLPLATAYFAAATTTALADAYAGQPDAGTRAIEYVIITALLGIGMTAWQSIESYLSQIMRYKVETAMSDRLYEHFLRLDFWRYDDKETVDAYEKARHFSQFFPSVFRNLTSLVTSIFTMITGVVALVFVSWWLALIALLAIIPGLFIQLRLSRLQAKHWNENIEGRRVVSWIEWGMMRPEKIAELRLYGLVRRLLDLRLELRDKDQKVRIEFERSFIWKQLGADALKAVAEVVALVWVGLQIIARQQPIGQFVYVQQVVSRAIGGAGSVISNISFMDEEIANLFEYQKFMELSEGSDDGVSIGQLSATLAVDNVSFRYPHSDHDVLKNVSLSIQRGQHVAIVGENGAGKSTLVKILVGLYAPTSGQVLVDDTPLSDIAIGSWHAMLGVLSQEFIQYDFANARHNISYGDTAREYDQVRLKRAIEMAEADFLYKLPKGLDTYVNQWMEDDEGNKGQDLSGGQWQRLALARNFYRDAPIIILDEPTSAIDALAEGRIFKRLFGLTDKTIITISHRLTTIEKADMVYMLKEGQLIEQGTTKELIARKGEFYAMFESQIKSLV